MSVHLTDDEIVAVCGLLDLAWPFSLPTIDTQSDEMDSAARRGLRSLTVRALIGFDPESNGAGINPEVADVVTAVATGKPVLVSGVIDREGALRASGSAAYVLETAEGVAVLATTTATGIHALATSTLADAREAFLALVDNALTSGIGGDDDARLLALRAGRGQEALAIGRDVVTVGSISAEGSFEPQSGPAAGWDRTTLDAHLAI